MKTSFFKTFLLATLILGVMGSPSWAQKSEDPNSILLEMPVHFLNPSGSDVFVQPGVYRVEGADNVLQFIPSVGPALLIGAEGTTHEEDVDVPWAFSIEGEDEEFKDMHMVMLLLPGGESLEAAGSYSGVRERGLRLPGFSKFKKRTRLKFKRAARKLRVRPAVGQTVRPAIKNIWPVGLLGFWMYDPAVPQVRKVQKTRGKWYWPGHYDLYPKLIHLTWGILPILSADLAKFVAKEGYGFELRLNGKLLQQGPNALSGDFYAYKIVNSPDPSGCPKGMTCLGTTILKTKWVSVPPPWTVELSYWKKIKKSGSGGQKPKKYKASAVMYPNQTTGKSYFVDKLNYIFQHERCKSCHALGSKQALVQRHNGILSEGMIQDVQGLLGPNLGCGGGCHVMIEGATQPVPNVVFHDSEWKTPKFEMGIDWRGKTAQYTCQKVTSSLTTPQMLKEHFFHDSRIAWAVHSGALPPPKGGIKLPKAPPGDYYKFKGQIEAWIRAGVPCPE